jgi:hypothetical protein
VEIRTDVEDLALVWIIFMINLFQTTSERKKAGKKKNFPKYVHCRIRMYLVTRHFGNSVSAGICLCRYIEYSQVCING